jgi:DNA-binding XRE family transcriptional regulator
MAVVLAPRFVGAEAVMNFANELDLPLETTRLTQRTKLIQGRSTHMQPAQTPAAPFPLNQFEHPSSAGRGTRAPLAGKAQTPQDGSSAPGAGGASRTPFYLPIDVSSRFGARLRELRRERNMTQLRMATDFGIDRSFISDVERGRKSISLPMLEVIALGMNMTLSDLLQNI